MDRAPAVAAPAVVVVRAAAAAPAVPAAAGALRARDDPRTVRPAAPVPTSRAVLAAPRGPGVLTR
ncbi:hypothetical protein ACFFHJ_34365 [Planotetraspora thailandica]|uniref:hypothetical protein n=1 Tax=Planotetraspora thailandica TaxID=487172 RepID=UPI001950B0AC|nr:hypothetical protein [Planotetraspora thailandica]